MASRLINLANAVAAAVNAATLPTPLTAAVAWMPFTDRAVSADLACWVVPSTEAPGSLSRGQLSHECEIFVALQKAAADETEVDGLAATLESIGDALAHRPLSWSGGTAHFVSMRIDPVLDLDHWNRLKQYTGVLRLTYRIVAVAGGGS